MKERLKRARDRVRIRIHRDFVQRGWRQPADEEALTSVRSAHRKVLLREATATELAAWQRRHSLEREASRVEAELRASAEARTLVTPLVEATEAAALLLHARRATRAEIVHHANVARRALPDEAELRAALARGEGRALIGMRPLSLEIDITTQCNLRCSMCYFSLPELASRKREHLAVEAFERFGAEVLPHCERVALSFGTEPLLHPRFEDLVAVCKRHRVPRTYMHTNGLLMDEARIERMVESGLHAIGVSVDAATQESYEAIRVGGRWDRLVKNLAALQRVRARHGGHRPHVTLTFVMMRRNVEELPRFVELAASFGFIDVHCTHMTPYEVLDNAHESLVHDQERSDRCVAEARRRATALGMQFIAPPPFRAEPQAEPEAARMEFAAAAFDLPLRGADTRRAACPFPWHFVGVDAFGNITPCGWWYTEPPLGNIHGDRFADVWNGPAWQALRAEHVARMPRKACAECSAAGMGGTTDREAFAPKRSVEL